jgi:LuxR family transcriptional regulator, quorum-sensing system regulator BjaR1
MLMGKREVLTELTGGTGEGMPRSATDRSGFQITQEDRLYRRAGAVHDRFTAYAVLKDIAALHGFATFALFVFGEEQSLKYGPGLYITNYTDDFLQKYDAENHLPNNFTIFKLRQSSLPITWDIRSYKMDPRRVERQRTIDLLAEYGMFMGANFALNDNRGGRGVMIFTGDRDIPGVAELASLNLLSNVIFDRLGIPSQDADAIDAFHLSERERQVLEWAAAGRTSREIAVIIELSEHTVNQYLASSIGKLDANNRVHAVAKALRLKLID